MRSVKLLAAATLLATASACSIKTGTYGLLATRDVSGTTIYREDATKLEGSSCTHFIIFFPISTGGLHPDQAVTDALESDPVKARTELVGVADADLRQTWFMVPLFYWNFCWNVKGVAAVKR